MADATVSPRAQTLPIQSLVNPIMRGVLRAPVLGRLAGRRLITLYVLGRKTGRRYAIPVAYTREHQSLLVGTPFGWGRNLRTGEPVQIRYRGKRRTADVEVVRDVGGVVALYGLMARDNHNFAKFNRIGLNAAGEPDQADLHLAWAAGARAIRLTLR
jgi:hypothetical protein